MQIGLKGSAHTPEALQGLSRAERVTYCNDAWARKAARLSVVDFDRSRKMMSVLVGDDDSSSRTLFLKVPSLPIAGPTSCLIRHLAYI